MRNAVHSLDTTSPFGNCLTRGIHLISESLSDRESAGRRVEHAVEYLVTEQLEGRRSSPTSNREAIAIFCRALAELARVGGSDSL